MRFGEGMTLPKMAETSRCSRANCRRMLPLDTRAAWASPIMWAARIRFFLASSLRIDASVVCFFYLNPFAGCAILHRTCSFSNTPSCQQVYVVRNGSRFPAPGLCCAGLARQRPHLWAVFVRSSRRISNQLIRFVLQQPHGHFGSAPARHF